MTAMQPSGTHVNSNNRSVVVLKTSDCTIRGNDVFMPITIVMSQIKKPEREQFKKVEITKEMTERDVEEKLLEKFPYLRNQRFCCAAAVDNRTRLDFNGDRRIWSGSLIKRLLKGNSALYIFVDEQVPGYANMVPQSEASSRSAVATATQNRVDLDVTLVTSLHSLPIGSSVHRESHCLTQPAQSTFCLSSVRDSPKKWQDAASPEQLTTKRPPEQMTTAENESNQTFKKLRATKGVSNNTERNVAGDLNARTPLRALGTATVQGRVSEKASRSYQTEGHLQNFSYGSADMKESAHVPAQLEPLSFDCHPSLASQETKNTTMAIPSHSHPMTTSSNVPVKYPVPQMNSPWTSEHDNHVLLQQFGNGNTQLIQPMETDTHGVNQDLNSSKSSRRWASSAKIAFSSKEPIIDDIEEAFQSPNFYLWESDSLDSEIDFSNLIALPEMDDSELTSLLSPSSFVGSLTPQASINVGLHNQKQRDNTIQMPELPNAMRTQVSHGMRGNYSDSGLGSQSSSSAPQSRNTSDIESSALEEYPIIKIRPNPVGLPGAPSCEFLGLAELFPEVASGYATVGNLDENILWEKGDKHGNGNCIPSSPKAGKQIVKIYSATGKKLAEAKLSYVDDCQHTEDECLKTVGERASQSYEELCRVMSDILIRCRPQASIKSGKTQHSGNSESSLIVQVLRFLINEAEESGLRWDSLPLLEFVTMNHDHENAALFLEEITDRYARDITPEGRERIDLSELLAAINASREEDEATDSSDGRNDSDSSYDGDVESLLCDSEEPTSDSEDDHSDMLRKAFATGNEIQMGANNAETDERVILNLPSGYLSGAQIGEKETQPTHSRLKDSTVSVKESVITERVSDQPFPTSSDSVLPFGKNGKFSRKAIAIKQREKDSKPLQGEYRISRIREHFNCKFPNLTSMKSVRQPIICFLLTTESINRCLSTMEDRWRIQLQLQRLSGRMTMSPLSMLFQAMHIKPEEALMSLSTDADLSSPSDNTSRTRCKPFDSPLPSNDSTPSDVVALTSIYRPFGKILLSFVSDRNGFLPPESWFEDEDCELLMECWKWRRCKNNLLALKVVEIKDQPASSGLRAQGRLATGVYKRPLWEEKGIVERVPENFIGRNWTGKTSLKTSLVWRANKSRENTEPEPEFLFEEQTSQLIYKGSMKKVKSHSSYAEDLSWNLKCSVTVPLKVIEKAKELSKPTDMSLQDCKEVEKAKDHSQEPSTKRMDPSLKLRVPKQPEDMKDYLMSSVYPPVIVNTNHPKTLSCVHADNPYHKTEPKHLVESSYGTLKDNAYSKRLKEPLVVDSKKSESSENVENILSFAERLPPTIKDLKKHQPMKGDVTELKSVIGEKRQDKTKPDNNEEHCTCSKEDIHVRLNESTVSLKESVHKNQMSDKPFTTSSDQLLPFANKGRFSRKEIAIKRRKKASKHIPEKQCIFQTEVHFDREFRNLSEMKSVRQSIVSSSLIINTEGISRCLSTMHERWRIQFQLQRLSGVMITPSISVLLYKISLNPAEGTSSFSLTKPACKVEDTITQVLESLDADGGLVSPSEKTSAARWEALDHPQPNYHSTASDAVVLTSIYRPTKRILLSFVSDRKGFYPPESLFEDEDCELLMECWKWRRCNRNFLSEKLIEIQDLPDSSETRAQGRLATGVYKRPLWEEKGLLKRVPKNFIGRDWTGKTSLKTSLVCRTNKSRENTELEPDFLFEQQTSQLIVKRSLKKVKSDSSYAEDLSWNPDGSLTVPLKVIGKAKELSKPTDMSLQDCKQVEKAKDDSQEPSTKGMDPSLKGPQDKLLVPKKPEDIKDYLMSSVDPPVIPNTDHLTTLSCLPSDDPYHKAEPKDLVEPSHGTLEDSAYSKLLKDLCIVNNTTSNSSHGCQNVENVLSFAEKLPPTIKDLKKPQPMRGDVAKLKSVIGEKQQDKTKPGNNEERFTFSEEGESSAGANLSQSRSFGLPNKVPKFVGRSDVCEEISGLLTSLETTLVSLIAPPGFGKTAIAITVGHEMLEKGKDVLYVSLRTVDSVEGAAKRLLEVIGIPADKDPVAQVKTLVSSLKKETMLVLDNAEDLQNADKPACNQFLEVVGEHGKNLVILITSRNPLSVSDFPFKKHRIPLKPLDDEASFFFLKHYAPNISDQLARHFANQKVCGGVPLFLKLTASFLESKTIDPIDLHRKLKNCPHGFLKVKDPNIQEFFSLLKVFYHHLRPEVKNGLSWLAAFPSVFTKMEAKNVLFCKDDYLDFQILLNSLVSHSVVQEEEVDNHQQYSLHPLVQAFCIACREDECKGYNMAIRLFSYHYLALLQKLNDDFITTNCKVAIDKYQMNKANIAHALSASTEDEVLKCYGINVSTETVNFLAKVMNQDEFISTYYKFLEIAETLPDNTLYSECLVSIGFEQLCYYSYKDAHRTTAKTNLQKAHDLQIDLGIYDTECQGHCKCKLGLCTFLAGDRKKGISLIAQGIGVRRKLVRSNHSGKMERMLLAGGFCDLGMALFTSGQHKAALNIWENICLVEYRELLGTHPFTASLLDHIGKIYHALGKPQQAVALKKESLRMRHLLLGDDNLDTARAYYGLGSALKELGSTQEALKALKKAREIQYRVIASKEDIERTEQEINSLRGNDAMAESTCRMLHELHLKTPCNVLS